VASDYEAICADNLRRYGTDIGRIGPVLLAERYDDRAHFIFELLQNAEDALSRRADPSLPRKVVFELTPTHLTVSHFGRPFDDADVRGVCGIAESTKDRSSIGRFGIGFKSVYTFTDRPEIHSGDEDFAIENYVLPKHAVRTARKQDETQIVLPLKLDDDTAKREIAAGFRQLGDKALLFLRHIDEIDWTVHGDVSGNYLRSNPELLCPNVRRITIIGQESGKPEVDQNWLVFDRDVSLTGQERIGRVEIAFSLNAAKDEPGSWSVQPVFASPLVVFFPTVVSTNLGFIVQGPYRTTPSRDNILRGEPWNQHLVEETASLLVEAMRWMRDSAMLNTSALRCLPLDRTKFQEGAMFTPIFDAVRQAFFDEPLLPRFGGGFVAAGQAKLARTQELRELISPEQMSALFDSKALAWLASGITSDREPEIHAYLTKELGIAEVRSATLVPRLTKPFLEAQSDEWVLRLYEFLSGHEATLRHRLETIPLIRLDDGKHVTAREGDRVNAFLPGAFETGFPTIRRAVCSTTKARSFLVSLGITEPDPVDDVIWNVLPKYRQRPIRVEKDAYAADIERIRAAFNTDSTAQRNKLRSILREVNFVASVDAGDGKRWFATPGRTYIPTERLSKLFAGVPNVLFVNHEYEFMRGEDMRELLEACGALRYPRPINAPEESIWSDRLTALRIRAGHAVTSGLSDRVEDWVLQGFEELLGYLPKLTPAQRIERSRLIWESLGDLEERRGRGIFDGSYTWSYYGKYSISFPAAFLQHLNEAAWVPSADGELVPPRLVRFDSLGWNPNPFLLTKIAFKPPIVEQLAKEVGIGVAVLDWLVKNGITSEAELKSRFGITDLGQAKPDAEADGQRGIPDPDGDGSNADGLGDGNLGRPGTGTPLGVDQPRAKEPHRLGDQGGERAGGIQTAAPGRGGVDQFISYLGVRPDEEEPDPDGLDQAARMAIEKQAIDRIIFLDPLLNRTPEGNPGFDLFEANNNGQPVRWVEVKAMKGCLQDRPVGLSRTQFEYAREKGDAYWLYVVEFAADPKKIRVLRIQNPFAHARTYTFDRGWIQIARLEPSN